MASSRTDNAGNYVNGGVVSPAVLTSTAADQHVNNVVKPALAVATTGIQNQATKVAQNTQNNDQIQAALTAAKQQADKIQSEINANNAKAASTVTPSGTPPAGMDSQIVLPIAATISAMWQYFLATLLAREVSKEK